MQYLAGYVVHKLYLKHRNLKNYKTKTNQQTITLLKACQLDPAKQIHAKLVKALTRGGLWCVNEHVEKIFLISEKYFSIKTDVSKRSIGIFSLVKSMMEYKPVKNAMESVIESIPDVQIDKNHIVQYDNFIHASKSIFVGKRYCTKGKNCQKRKRQSKLFEKISQKIR